METQFLAMPGGEAMSHTPAIPMEYSDYANDLMNGMDDFGNYFPSGPSTMQTESGSGVIEFGGLLGSLADDSSGLGQL